MGKKLIFKLNIWNLLLYVFTIIFLISTITVNFITAYADSLQSSNLNIEAEGYILMDSSTGLVLCSEDADKTQIYPASTTKIMTAIVALENKNLDTIMTASQSAIDDIGAGGMNIGIMAGEELTLWDLLNAMLVCSANEAANIIAENVASTREEFINLMNEKAKELGAFNTNFCNTNGMHDENHYTTARDMALIAKHAMSIPTFRDIVKQDSYEMPTTNKHKSWNTLYTTNKLLRYGTGPNCNFNIIGIKTGFTTPAGHNLVAAASNEDGMELISVILGVKNELSWENIYKYTEKLLQYGFNNFSIEDLLKKDTYVTTINVTNAKDNIALDLVSQNSISAIVPIIDASADIVMNSDIDGNLDKTRDWNIIKKIHINPTISAPIEKGTVLGYIEFIKENIVLGKSNIIAANEIQEEIVVYSFKNSLLFKVFKITIIIALCFCLLRFILKRISRKVNMRKVR